MPCVSYPDSEQPLPFVARGKLPAYNQHKYKLQHPPDGLDALDLLQSSVNDFFPIMYTITKRLVLMNNKNCSFKARGKYKSGCFSEDSRKIRCVSLRKQQINKEYTTIILSQITSPFCTQFAFFFSKRAEQSRGRSKELRLIDVRAVQWVASKDVLSNAAPNGAPPWA